MSQNAKFKAQVIYLSLSTIYLLPHSKMSTSKSYKQLRKKSVNLNLVFSKLSPFVYKKSLLSYLR